MQRCAGGQTEGGERGGLERYVAAIGIFDPDDHYDSADPVIERYVATIGTVNPVRGGIGDGEKFFEVYDSFLGFYGCRNVAADFRR